MDTSVSKHLLLPQSECRQINAQKGIFFFLSPMDFDFFFSFCNFLCELEMKTIHLVPQRAAGVNGITV